VKWLNDLKASWHQLRARPVRTGLSVVGIYIGVLALVVILVIEAGIRRQIEESFSSRGARVVFIHPGFDQVAKKVGRLTLDDIDRLKNIPGVLSVQPSLTQEWTVRSPQGAVQVRVAGVDENFISVHRVPMLQGRSFVPDEARRKQPVCLLTADTAKKLFPLTPPVGSTLEISGISMQVIGLVDWTQQVSMRTGLHDIDMLVPLDWVLAQTGQFIGTLEVRVSESLSIDQAIRTIKETLTRKDASRQDLYMVRSMEEIEKKGRAFFERFLVGILAIAAISLLVGGIGIANVMVTSVTERTREIGIRKALGARRTDILTQFLVEAAMLSVTGALLAVATGLLGISLVQSLIEFSLPLAIPYGAIGICLLVTMGIGILAGLYPASQAASLSPAEALRYE
jgi:ABC-type antimicrobial peptide transport system permease subunit